MLTTQADRIETGVRSVIRRVESDQEGFIKLIQAAITAQVREATIALKTQQGRVIDGAEKAICDAKLGVTRLLDSITQRGLSAATKLEDWIDYAIRSDCALFSLAQFDNLAQKTRLSRLVVQKTQIEMESERSEVERLVHTVTLKAQTRLDAAALDLDQIKTQVGRDTGRMVAKAVDDLDQSLSLLESGAISIIDDGRKDIESFARIIVGMGPQSTLQRGLAIARDDDDKPLTSREAAMSHDSFQVQFRDGRVAVKNTDHSGGDER